MMTRIKKYEIKCNIQNLIIQNQMDVIKELKDKNDLLYQKNQEMQRKLLYYINRENELQKIIQCEQNQNKRILEDHKRFLQISEKQEELLLKRIDYLKLTRFDC
jgi:hypothetical protein